jgi:hypothetical protein
LYSETNRKEVFNGIDNMHVYDNVDNVEFDQSVEMRRDESTGARLFLPAIDFV